MDGFWIFATVATLFGGMSLWGIFDSWFKHRERRLELQMKLAAKKVSQNSETNAELEARVRVLEKIVTDGGLETAAQIEALRPARLSGEKIS